MEKSPTPYAAPKPGGYPSIGEHGNPDGFLVVSDMQKIIKILTNIFPSFEDWRRDNKKSEFVIYELAARPTNPSDVVAIDRTNEGFQIRHQDPTQDFEILTHAVQKVWRRDEEAERLTKVKTLRETFKATEAELDATNAEWKTLRDQVQPGGTHVSLTETSGKINFLKATLDKLEEELTKLGVPVEKTETPEKTVSPTTAGTILFDTQAFDMSGVEEISFTTVRFQELVGQALTKQFSGVLTRLDFETGWKIKARFSYKKQ